MVDGDPTGLEQAGWGALVGVVGGDALVGGLQGVRGGRDRSWHAAASISPGGTRMPVAAVPETSTPSNRFVNSMTAASPSWRTRRTISATAS